MRTRICILVLIVNLCFSSLNIAQTVDRNVAISAYIYNFAKNVIWQNEESISNFRFHIIGDDMDIINEMKSMAESKTIRGKSIP